MIYKNYDNQIEEYKENDWSLRNKECTEVETKYEQNF